MASGLLKFLPNLSMSYKIRYRLVADLLHGLNLTIELHFFPGQPSQSGGITLPFGSYQFRQQLGPAKL